MEVLSGSHTLGYDSVTGTLPMRLPASVTRINVKRKLDLHFGDRIFFRVVAVGAIGMVAPLAR